MSNVSDSGPVCGGQQVVFAGPQRYRGFDQLGETAKGVVGAAGLVDRGREIFGDALIQGSPDQVGLRRKPAVEGSLTDSRTARDRLHWCIGPQLAIDVPRRAQNALDVAGRIRSQRPVFHRGHRDSLTDS